MTLEDAERYASKTNNMKDLTARVVRILPATIDPIQDGDSGWDVEITVD